MNVVLDTEIIVGASFMLTNSNFRILFEKSARAGHVVYLPEVAYDEIINKFNETVDETAERMQAGLEKIKRLSGMTLNDVSMIVDTVTIKNNFKQIIDSLISDEKITLLPYPKISHKNIIRRALQRRKPFDGEGRKGYRDALIWETILDLLATHKNSTIAFLSGNKSDFGDGQKQIGLHQHLREDVEATTDLKIPIEYFVNLDDFVTKHLVPRLEILDSIRTQLTDGTYPGLNLEKYADSLIRELFSNGSVASIKSIWRKLGFLPVIFDLSFTGEIESVYCIDVIDVMRFSESELLIDFTAMCDPDINFSVLRKNIESLPDYLLYSLQEFNDSPDKASAHDNEPTGFGHVSIEVQIEIRIIFNEISKASSWQIRHIWRDFIDL